MKSLSMRAAILFFSLVAPAVPLMADEGTPRWRIETVAGDGRDGDIAAASDAALATSVAQPFGVEVGPDGALYVTSIGQHRVLRVDRKQGTIRSVAGNGKIGYSGDGGPATAAQLNEPYEVRFDRHGNMYFVEMKNHLIRRVDGKTGAISTVAGAPQEGFAGDGGPAGEARFRQPHSIALDDQNNLYVADILNHRIRAIDLASGTIKTIAGDGTKAMPRDGSLAAGQPIFGPRALSVVGRTMWIALREGNSVWRLDLDSGVINHVAGTGQQGYSGDGGPALKATFNGPKGIAATAGGIVWLVDSENQAIRTIDSRAGTVYTVAGGGPKARGFAESRESALSAKVDRPHGICIAPGGGAYIGDTNNHRVRWIRP